MNPWNFVQLIGVAKYDPISRTNEAGKEYASVVLNVKDVYINQQGDEVSLINQQRVICFGTMAKRLTSAVRKGDRLIIQGRISSMARTLEDKKIYSREIVLNSFEVLQEGDEEAEPIPVHHEEESE